MDVLVVAGEASGDAHAADLVRALKAHRSDLRFFGMGGPKLAAEGVELLFGMEEISVMGIAEVLPKLPRILKVMGALAAAAATRRPVAAILVDVPDFNLRLAPRLKRLGVRVISYVSPMVWAWRSGRTKQIARRYDELLCILPFEERFLRERGVNATYVGNPVVDQVPGTATAEDFRRGLRLDPARPVLGLLPGSRRSEVGRLLPTMVQVARAVVALHPQTQVVVPVAPLLPVALLEAAFVGSGVTPRFVQGQAPAVVGASTVSVVASGTATLEAALMGRPLVAIYKVSWLTYWVGRLLVRLPFFTLPNLLANKRVIPELLQGEVTPSRVAAEVEALWSGAGREALLGELGAVRAALGPGGASERAAQKVLAQLEPTLKGSS
jgi:lipid-A-disaccharide synthase